MREVKYRTLDTCRICDGDLRRVVHLCNSSIANSLEPTQEDALDAPVLPLTLTACEDCGLFQLSIAVDKGELFGAYTYATPDTPSMREHYHDVLGWIPRRVGGEGCCGTAVEIGGNTGAFLNLLGSRGYLGKRINVEPAVLEQVSERHDVLNEFFGLSTALAIRERYGLDESVVGAGVSLVAARHCFAHIDDLHEIMRGVDSLLADGGIFYIENAYLLDTLWGAQFDQVYHEHMSYLSLGAVDRLMRMYGMRLVDARVSPLHGGSIMMLAAREGSSFQASSMLHLLMRQEKLELAAAEQHFLSTLRSAVSSTVQGVEKVHASGGVVDAYGAAAKAVTRFAAAGLTHKEIRQCVDDSPLKIGKFLPGSGIPIVSREQWRETEPVAKACVLTAWNYKQEFEQREREYVQAGGRFIK